MVVVDLLDSSREQPSPLRQVELNEVQELVVLIDRLDLFDTCDP